LVENWDYEHFHIRISSSYNGSQCTYSFLYLTPKVEENNDGAKDNDVDYAIPL
jgi:hypothetical protein